jgi:hypothetical protein
VVQEIACLSREQAEAIVGAIAEVAGAEFVTRKDLALVRGALELPIERLRGELQRFILVSVVLVSAAADQTRVLKIWH